MGIYNDYRQKLRTASEAIKVVRAGDWVDYGFGLARPIRLDTALAARKDELKDIKVRGALSLTPLQIVECDPEREVFTYSSWHFSGYERQLHDQRLCNYIPMIYRNKPLFYRKDLDVDVAIISAAPMDKHGYFNLSLTNSATMAKIDKAKYVIIEINNKLPRALGGREETVHISKVDYIVETDNPPLPVLQPISPTDTDLKIAGMIVEKIENGSTIQLGIGGMPNSVGGLLADSDLKDLGMHTEMLVDAYFYMFKKGRLTNKQKKIDRGKGVWTFCMGSQELYDWVDDNSGLASYPVNYTNSPQIMAQNERLVTINNCVEVDLYGQVSSESSGSRHISGTGGQLDFLTGGYMSRGGKSFICFTSTVTDKKTGQVISRVVPTLPAGGIVTDPRTQANYLVTEWGMVNLAGRSTWERTEMIISIAHPDFREDLIKEAQRMKIWRRSSKIIS